MVTPESGSIPAGTPVPLIFTAVNESPVRKATDPADYYPQPLNDELVSVTYDLADFQQALDELRKGNLRITPEGAQGAQPVKAEAPPWLTSAFLGEQERQVQPRTGELLARLKAGVEHAGQKPPPDPQDNPLLITAGFLEHHQDLKYRMLGLESFQKGRFEEALRAVIPSVERIRLERAPVTRSELQQITINGRTTTSPVEREYVGHRIVFDMRGAPGLPAHAASEGTLITLGILTAIISRTGPHLVLLDDLERAIHPRAIADLVAQLRQLLASFPDLQIVATSHSPYLIDHLAPEEVRLMITDEGGSVVCARLSDHPELDRWQAFMRAGEIWSMVGEEWVRDRGAQPHA